MNVFRLSGPQFNVKNSMIVSVMNFFLDVMFVSVV